ncbi:hypothetical protein I545_6918 [Mycobacterium kansasii 662]|uniref:Uncharacterized protein n=1 Tax=Mycobacterium kansasii 662 TaxID=1299326 RepID=X7XR42_MYCKA|nr:hypothetical protein I545_6918 [Mycobacterium kansasii 662]
MSTMNHLAFHGSGRKKFDAVPAAAEGQGGLRVGPVAQS